MTMQRFHDWPERLASYVATRADLPFEWGVHDCATFALGAIEAMTGIRLVAVTHYDAASATRYLEANGVLRELARRHLGEPVAPLQARRGDLVLVDAAGRDALAVCMGETVVAVSAERGTVALPLDAARAAWRV